MAVCDGKGGERAVAFLEVGRGVMDFAAEEGYRLRSLTGTQEECNSA